MLDHWPLVGRDQEIDEVTGLIGNNAYRGVALAGKPGVGKSRLAREAIRAAADAGWTVRRAAATATSRSIPLGAFAQWTDDFEGAPLALARRVIAALTIRPSSGGGSELGDSARSPSNRPRWRAANRAR